MRKLPEVLVGLTLLLVISVAFFKLLSKFNEIEIFSPKPRFQILPAPRGPRRNHRSADCMFSVLGFESGKWSAGAAVSERKSAAVESWSADMSMTA